MQPLAIEVHSIRCAAPAAMVSNSSIDSLSHPRLPHTPVLQWAAPHQQRQCMRHRARPLCQRPPQQPPPCAPPRPRTATTTTTPSPSRPPAAVVPGPATAWVRLLLPCMQQSQPLCHSSSSSRTRSRRPTPLAKTLPPTLLLPLRGCRLLLPARPALRRVRRASMAAAARAGRSPLAPSHSLPSQIPSILCLVARRLCCTAPARCRPPRVGEGRRIGFTQRRLQPAPPKLAMMNFSLLTLLRRAMPMPCRLVRCPGPPARHAAPRPRQQLCSTPLCSPSAAVCSRRRLHAAARPAAAGSR